MARYGAPTSNLGDKGGGSDDGERKIELSSAIPAFSTHLTSM